MAAGYVYAGLAAYELISGSQQAELVRDQAKLNNKINEMNIEFAELDAYKAEIQGYSEEAYYKNVIEQTESSQKVAFASQNIDFNFGTAKQIQEESRLTGFLNQLDIRNKAHDVALGYKNQAMNLRLQGTMNSLEADVRAGSIKNAAILGAGKTVAGYYAQKGKG